MNPDSKYYQPWRTYGLGHRVLTTKQKTEIQRRRWEGETITALAAEYGVSRSTVQRCRPWDGKL